MQTYTDMCQMGSKRRYLKFCGSLCGACYDRGCAETSELWAKILDARELTCACYPRGTGGACSYYQSTKKDMAAAFRHYMKEGDPEELLEWIKNRMRKSKCVTC